MQTVTTIGLDIAKSVFQIHGVDAAGNVIVRRQLKRRYVLPFFQKLPPCLIGIEACASSLHWSRELQALGHTVRLMPPAYVKGPRQPSLVLSGIAKGLGVAGLRVGKRIHDQRKPVSQVLAGTAVEPHARSSRRAITRKPSCLISCSDSRPGGSLSWWEGTAR
jgi:transposase